MQNEEQNPPKIQHLDIDILQRKWSWWNVGAIFGLAAGMGTIFIGILLTLMMWLFKLDSIRISLQTVTNVLFYSAFPLLFFGAYCLDKIPQKPPQNFEQ
ncbi:MAG: hypothetical protein K1X72_12915 [Pyrinomonadaceae bacterium]|nr:hypothetical protein [Pyrinomonadaceae bacterium]